MDKQHSLPEKTWWKDPATISDVIVFVAALASIVVSIGDVFDLWTIQWFSQRLHEIIIGLVSLLTLSILIERRFVIKRWQDSLIQELRESRIGPYQGLSNVYARRDHLPRFPEVVRDATEEIFILGVNLGYIALHQTRTLEEKAISGCRIKLLLVDPGTEDSPNPLLEPMQETFSEPQIGELLKTSLHRLTHWKSQLSTSVSRRIEIRTTRSLPIHSATFVDKDLPSGKMLLLMLAPKTDEKWGVLVEARKGGELYSRYVKVYEAIWNEALQLE